MTSTGLLMEGLGVATPLLVLSRTDDHDYLGDFTYVLNGIDHALHWAKITNRVTTYDTCLDS